MRSFKFMLQEQNYFNFSVPQNFKSCWDRNN